MSEAWLFSWGYGQEHPNRYVRIEGTYFEARAEMIRRYGRRWAFQYPESEELQLQACDMWPLPDPDKDLNRQLDAIAESERRALREGPW